MLQTKTLVLMQQLDAEKTMRVKAEADIEDLRSSIESVGRCREEALDQQVHLRSRFWLKAVPLSQILQNAFTTTVSFATKIPGEVSIVGYDSWHARRRRAV